MPKLRAMKRFRARIQSHMKATNSHSNRVRWSYSQENNSNSEWVERRAGVKIGTTLQTISLYFLRFNGQKSSFNSTIDCSQCHSFHQMLSLTLYRQTVAFENIEARASDRQQKKKTKSRNQNRFPSWIEWCWLNPSLKNIFDRKN